MFSGVCPGMYCAGVCAHCAGVGACCAGVGACCAGVGACPGAVHCVVYTMAVLEVPCVGLSTSSQLECARR